MTETTFRLPPEINIFLWFISTHLHIWSTTKWQNRGTGSPARHWSCRLEAWDRIRRRRPSPRRCSTRRPRRAHRRRWSAPPKRPPPRDSCTRHTPPKPPPIIPTTPPLQPPPPDSRRSCWPSTSKCRRPTTAPLVGCLPDNQLFMQISLIIWRYIYLSLFSSLFIVSQVQQFFSFYARGDFFFILFKFYANLVSISGIFFRQFFLCALKKLYHIFIYIFF